MGKIKVLLEKFLALSFPLKFLVSSLISSIVGSSYIIFLSEYATFYYAWSEGFRIPAEGTHYLTTTIGAISFFLIISGFILYFIILIFFKFLDFFLLSHNKGITKEVLTLLVDNNPKNILGILGASLFLGLASGVAGFISENRFETKDLVQLIILGTFFSLLVFMSMWSKKTLIIISASIAILFSVLSPIVLFNHEIYGTIIKELGYGGKLPIIITEPEKNKRIEASLYLRTISSLFISTKDNSQVIEYPIKDIKYIEYLPKE